MKKIVKRFFRWIFEEELSELNRQISAAKNATKNASYLEERLKALLGNVEVSVDVHEHNRFNKSWAVISLQGQRTDYIKFIDLGDRDINEISHFIRQYDRRVIDASPSTTKFLKMVR